MIFIYLLDQRAAEKFPLSPLFFVKPGRLTAHRAFSPSPSGGRLGWGPATHPQAPRNFPSTGSEKSFALRRCRMHPSFRHSREGGNPGALPRNQRCLDSRLRGNDEGKAAPRTPKKQPPAPCHADGATHPTHPPPSPHTPELRGAWAFRAQRRAEPVGTGPTECRGGSSRRKALAPAFWNHLTERKPS